MTSICEAYEYYWINQRLKERTLWETARLVAFYSGFGTVKGMKKPMDIQVFPWEQTEETDKTDKGTKLNPWTKADHDRMRKEGHPFFKKWQEKV